jgi:ATP-dependent Clp protease, protease subunit
MLNFPPELQGMLLDRRVVFVRGQLSDATANEAIPQLLLISQTAGGKPIELYLDSAGGSLAASLAIYDVMQSLSSPVSVTCTSTAGGAAVLLLAGGAAGRRFALPHARIHLFEDEPGINLVRTGDDQARMATVIADMRIRWREALARHTSHSAQHIERDLTASRWLSTAEARDYGIVDGIVPGQPGGPPI